MQPNELYFNLQHNERRIMSVGVLTDVWSVLLLKVRFKFRVESVRCVGRRELAKREQRGDRLRVVVHYYCSSLREGAASIKGQVAGH